MGLKLRLYEKVNKKLKFRYFFKFERKYLTLLLKKYLEFFVCFYIKIEFN